MKKARHGCPSTPTSQIQHLGQRDQACGDRHCQHLQPQRNRMNHTPNTAAAPIKTALFHIGSSPSRTPEKMKPGKVWRKRSIGATTSCFGSVAPSVAASLSEAPPLSETEGISSFDDSGEVSG